MLPCYPPVTAEAASVFRDDLAKFPENGWSLYGLSKALRAEGQTVQANEVEATLKKVWATADVSLDDIF